jgi:hypothetical protein
MRQVLYLARDDKGLRLILAREDRRPKRKPGASLRAVRSFDDAADAAAALIELQAVIAQLPATGCLAR